MQSRSCCGHVRLLSSINVGTSKIKKAAVTACRAAPVKKKGVKVVHGKEIPWNLFTPKAPYQAKVVPNQKHPQTLTEETQ
eukprot:s1040_g7.t1